jgi:hypothetical protein
METEEERRRRLAQTSPVPQPGPSPMSMRAASNGTPGNMPAPTLASQPGVTGKTAAELFAAARQASGITEAVPGKPQVDKYFGSKLPPVCRQLGCYVTDDGKFFYCINPHCHKDKKRETKYNRRKKSVVYFFCPKCKSREIQLHLKVNSYECLDCAYSWKH